MAFGTDTQAELARINDGDSSSVQGILKADFYGAARISMTLFADQVLALRQPQKAKAPKQDGLSVQKAAPTPEGSARAGHSTPETRGTPCDPYDEIPFVLTAAQLLPFAVS